MGLISNVAYLIHAKQQKAQQKQTQKQIKNVTEISKDVADLANALADSGQATQIQDAKAKQKANIQQHKWTTEEPSEIKSNKLSSSLISVNSINFNSYVMPNNLRPSQEDKYEKLSVKNYNVAKQIEKHLGVIAKEIKPKTDQDTSIKKRAKAQKSFINKKLSAISNKLIKKIRRESNKIINKAKETGGKVNDWFQTFLTARIALALAKILGKTGWAAIKTVASLGKFAWFTFKNLSKMSWFFVKSPFLIAKSAWLGVKLMGKGAWSLVSGVSSISVTIGKKLAGFIKGIGSVIKGVGNAFLLGFRFTKFLLTSPWKAGKFAVKKGAQLASKGAKAVVKITQEQLRKGISSLISTGGGKMKWLIRLGVPGLVAYGLWLFLRHENIITDADVDAMQKWALNVGSKGWKFMVNFVKNLEIWKTLQSWWGNVKNVFMSVDWKGIGSAFWTNLSIFWRDFKADPINAIMERVSKAGNGLKRLSYEIMFNFGKKMLEWSKTAPFGVSNVLGFLGKKLTGAQYSPKEYQSKVEELNKKIKQEKSKYLDKAWQDYQMDIDKSNMVSKEDKAKYRQQATEMWTERKRIFDKQKNIYKKRLNNIYQEMKKTSYEYSHGKISAQEFNDRMSKLTPRAAELRANIEGIDDLLKGGINKLANELEKQNHPKKKKISYSKWLKKYGNEITSPEIEKLKKEKAELDKTFKKQQKNPYIPKDKMSWVEKAEIQKKLTKRYDVLAERMKKVKTVSGIRRILKQMESVSKKYKKITGYTLHQDVALSDSVLAKGVMIVGNKVIEVAKETETYKDVKKAAIKAKKQVEKQVEKQVNELKKNNPNATLLVSGAKDVIKEGTKFVSGMISNTFVGNWGSVLSNLKVLSEKAMNYTGPGIRGGCRILLDQIAKGEGTLKGPDNGYNVTYRYGKYDPPHQKPLTSMTIAEVKMLQVGMVNNGAPKAAPVGRYQFAANTLPEAAKLAGANDSTIFSAKLQDNMAMALLNQIGFKKWKAGQISDEDFHLRLAKKWASIECPTKPGRSCYSKDKVGTSTAEIRFAMKACKEGSVQKVMKELNQASGSSFLSGLEKMYTASKNIYSNSNITGTISNMFSSGINTEGIANTGNVVDYARQFKGKFAYSMDLRNQTINGVSYLDCSSFIQKVIRGAGIDPNFPSTTYTQVSYLDKKAKAGDGVIRITNISDLKAGDLVYFMNQGHHVVMMASDTTIIHESSSAGNVVEVSADYLKRRPPSDMFRYTTAASPNTMPETDAAIKMSNNTITPPKNSIILPGMGTLTLPSITMGDVMKDMTSIREDLKNVMSAVTQIGEDTENNDIPDITGELNAKDCMK